MFWRATVEVMLHSRIAAVAICHRTVTHVARRAASVCITENMAQITLWGWLSVFAFLAWIFYLSPEILT